MKRICLLYLFISLLSSCAKDDEVIVRKEFILSFSADGSVSEEGGFTSFTFRLSDRLSSDLSIQINTGGTATNGIDYEEVALTTTIPANQLSSKITIKAIEDLDKEGDESIIITVEETSNEDVIIEKRSETVLLIDGPTREDVIRNEQRILMVNQNATDETVSLFYNLKELAKSAFLVGQQDAFSRFFRNDVGDSDIKKATGSDPGLLGSDFMFITDDQNDGTSSNWFFQQEISIKEDALAAYNNGMVNVFAWHFNEPYEGNSFYTSEMTDFQKQNAFRSILPGGENHEYYKTKLRKVAEVMKSMIGNSGEPIPVIFRPFHEFDGDWFWWGKPYATAGEFIQCWQFTVDYLTIDQGVNNVLFAYSPDNQFVDEATYLERYPGDGYVDVLGMDNYGDFRDGNQMTFDNANLKLQVISGLALAKGKVAAMTETCYFIEPGITQPLPDFYSRHLYDVLTQNDVQVSFMMFWSNSQKLYCTPVPGAGGFADFLNFIDSPESILANDMDDIYTITTTSSES